jgi:membrane-associated phospholipid phosphatase
VSQAGAKPQIEIPSEPILEEGGTSELDATIFRERLIERLRILWNRRHFLARAVLAGMVFGCLLAFVLPVEYESSAQLMPPDAQSGAGMAMLASLAARNGNGLGAVAGDLLGVKSSGALFVGIWGKMSHDEHRREAGLRSGEAFFNALAVTSAFQQITGRERPFVDNTAGRLDQYGAIENSFPLNHAAAAWSVASGLEHEYPGPLTKIFAWEVASAVSVTRVTGRMHFLSDVLIGSASGYLMGRQVYQTHQSLEMGGAPWGSPLDEHAEMFEGKLARPGSVYVPIESWVYPAFERLAALSLERANNVTASLELSYSQGWIGKR